MVGLLAGSVFGVAALTLGGAVSAQAHVTVGSSTNVAGAQALLTFAFSHGCDGSATTRIAISIPGGINSVTPTVNPGWTVEKSLEELAAPITDSHGNQVTRRVAEVIYTAKEPVADGLRDTFTLTVKLPEDAAGATIAFPTIQECLVGSYEWVEIPAVGQDPHELAAPAPSLQVVAADTSLPDAGGSVSDGQMAPDSFSVIALIVGVLGLLTGGTALIAARRKSED